MLLLSICTPTTSTCHYTVVALALFPRSCIYNTIIATKLVAVVNYSAVVVAVCQNKCQATKLNSKQTLQYFKPIDIRTHIPCACR